MTACGSTEMKQQLLPLSKTFIFNIYRPTVAHPCNEIYAGAVAVCTVNSASGNERILLGSTYKHSHKYEDVVRRAACTIQKDVRNRRTEKLDEIHIASQCIVYSILQRSTIRVRLYISDLVKISFFRLGDFD